MTMDPTLPWEQKGRGFAVFQCDGQIPFAGIDARPGTVVISSAAALPSIQGTEQRIVVTDFSEAFLSSPPALDTLINTVILPVYRRRIPLYFFTNSTTDVLTPIALPLEDQLSIPGIFRRLSNEQLRTLLASMCIVFSSPGVCITKAGMLLTPVERALAAAFDRAGISYGPRVSVGPWIVDFLLTAPGGTRLAVEADGRDFIDAEQQARDDHLIQKHGITDIIRFSGSQILHGSRRCVEQVRKRLSAHHPARVYPPPEPALSPEQAQCLSPHAGVVLTLAPAGSGKTRVLTRRVVEAVRGGIAQERVLCVVFNKAASDVMGARIHQESGLHGIRICTLHSLGYEICRTAPGSRYAGFNVVTTQSLRGGIRHLYREALKRDLAVRKPSHRKRARPIFPEHLAAAYEEVALYRKKTWLPIGAWPDGTTIEGFDFDQAVRVSETVEEELYRRRLLLFDDQILRAVETLLMSPGARRYYQTMFDTMLVDEVQDLTPVQFLLIRLLALPLNNLFAVGDDDQIINSFAGADPANIRDFQKTFAGATIHTLGENHRCAPDIVVRSANVITYNRTRFPKPIRPSAQQLQTARNRSGTHPPAVSLFHGSSLDAETQAVLRMIRQWRAEGFTCRDIAILVRVKSIASLIQIVLTEEKIPFHPLEQTEFFTSRIGRLLGAYMRICHHPETAVPEDYSLALSTPSRSLSNTHLRRVAYTGWRLVQHAEAFPTYAQSAVREFCETVDRIHRKHCVSTGTSLDFLNTIIEQFHIEEYFTRRERSSRRTTTSASGDIIDMIRHLADESSHIPTFVNRYNLGIREEEESTRKTDSNGDGVSLSTIHGSKGDEYRAVVIFHAAEYTIPHRQMVASGNPAHIEEERRVFYVAVTRAIERLFITTDAALPSRFLPELDRPYRDPRKDRSIGVREAFQPGGVMRLLRRVWG